MSGGLGKLSATSQTSFNKMAQHADKVNQKNKILGQSYDELQKKIKQTENVIRTSTVSSQIASAKRELASPQRMSGKHPGNIGGNSGGSGFGSIFTGNLAADMAMRAGTAFLGIVKDGIGSAIAGSMAKEQAVTGLSTFIGKSGAEEAYANIRKDAEISPYGTESLLGVNRALISAGLNAKDAREDTMNLANAIAAVGGGDAELSRMAANMQQIKTVGKATAMDIKQFGMVGINIYEMLSRSTGKSIDQVKEMDVSYNELAKALAMARSEGGIYAGALEAQGKTMAGQWNAMKDMGENALVDLGDAIAPLVIGFMKIGQSILSYIRPGIAAVSNFVKGIMNDSGSWSGWMDIVGKYVKIIFTFVGSIFGLVGKIVWSMIEWVGKSEILKDIFRVIGWVAERIFLTISWIADKIGWIWDNVIAPIFDSLENMYKWVKDMIGSDGEIKVKGTIEKSDAYKADLTRFSGKGSLLSSTEESKKNKESSKKTGETISGGGPKVINVSVGKFFDNIQFTTMNGKESADELEKIVMECLGRVIYNGAKVM